MKILFPKLFILLVKLAWSIKSLWQSGYFPFLLFLCHSFPTFFLSLPLSFLSSLTPSIPSFLFLLFLSFSFSLSSYYYHYGPVNSLCYAYHNPSFLFCKSTGQRLCGSIYCISDTLLHAGLIYLLFRFNLKRAQNNALHIIVTKYIWHFDTAPSALQDFLNFQHSKAHFVFSLSQSYYQLCLQKL